MSQRGIYIFNNNGQRNVNDPERKKHRDQRVGHGQVNDERPFFQRIN